MNERINELRHKTTLQCNEHIAEHLWDTRGFDTVWLNIFAELIVRECIDKITTYDLVPGHSAKWEDIYDIHTRLLQDLGEELKEHFGVTK
jgi:hypothetical protein